MLVTPGRRLAAKSRSMTGWVSQNKGSAVDADSIISPSITDAVVSQYVMSANISSGMTLVKKSLFSCEFRTQGQRFCQFVSPVSIESTWARVRGGGAAAGSGAGEQGGGRWRTLGVW